ncbi:hypothetical protein [Mycolicibacterium goodii]|uniref:Uncharacterized protein n=1 Tax=Mycolicibacterium goodii TaxID=134601 RepID=A0ABS6HPL7_MYCGD|nr:hypothetical protein [Mycolicibacterium goodii]MBU8824133.1 hypothetical protein [Mycolicibacterium goodii]MBU8838084.1 hypothetical protein [Mycolicibacterium goodii]
MIAEVELMPDAAIEFVRKNVGWVVTPEHLIPLRTEVREHHGGKLVAVFEALKKRFGRSDTEWFGAFQAAAEHAVMVEVGGDTLTASDKRVLRDLWEHLLRAQ